MKIIRLKQVIELTSLSRSSIYSFIKQGVFPKPINLGANSVGWIESEIIDWITQKVSDRDSQLDCRV